MADVIVYWGRAAVRGARRARVVRCGSRAGAPSSLQPLQGTNLAPCWRTVFGGCADLLPHVKLKLNCCRT